MNTDTTVSVLVEVARRAALHARSNGVTHPEDLVSAMVAALDGAAEALDVLNKMQGAPR